MEIFQTTAKIQQSQTPMPRTAVADLQSTQSVQQIQKAQITQDQAAQVDTEQKTSKADTQKQMDHLIEQLNRSLDPFNTSVRFGFDNSSKDFYVSVIDTKTDQMLRRFPLEQAQQLLPKIQEVNGLLFDKKG
jgi:flagellar protein FlaG